MKDYLIQFGDDGRRGATYAANVHYYVNDDGSITNGSVDVDELLKQGYVFVSSKDYNNLLGNNEDRQEYCRQADGTFAPYVAPDPTESEKKAAKINTIKEKYNSQLDAMVTARVKATMLGADTSKIDANYKNTLAAMAAEIKNA